MSVSRHPDVEVAREVPRVEAPRLSGFRAWLRRIWLGAPSRRVWLRLFSSPSSYLLAVAALLTFAAKVHAAFTLELPFAPLLGLRASLLDFAILSCVAALLAWVEPRAKLLGLLTVPIAIVVSAAAIANATYLVVAGEQGSREALLDLWERRSEALMILGEELADPSLQTYLANGVLSLFAFLVLLRVWLSRRACGGFRWDNTKARARLSAIIAGTSGSLVLVLPAPVHFEAHKLARSALYAVLRGPANALTSGKFQGWGEAPAVSPAEIDALATRRRPDVVLVVLESVRFDFTSLAGANTPASTPHLAELAERGWSAPTTRAVLPHTSKSLFSILCGRVPVMQKSLVELSSDTPVQCLPRVLASAGYRTKFFQSAVGTFEHRARLVDKLGFGEFAAFEDLGGRRLGYVGSEDGPLAKAALAWLDERAGDEPSLVTLLTSATHHPYRLSKSSKRDAQRAGLPHEEPEDRYARLNEAAADMLGARVDGLRERKKLGDTLLVVVADHGEGFGEHAVKQHDNNFYEEGLRVPFVVSGPGVSKGSRFDGNASLLDVMPTVLAALNVKPLPGVLQGYNLRGAPPPPGEPRPFGCYNPQRCRGFVTLDRKVVAEPGSGERWYFDLEADPDEREPRVLPRGADMKRMLAWVDEVVDSRRVEDWEIRYERIDRFAPWSCPEGRAKCSPPRRRR